MRILNVDGGYLVRDLRALGHQVLTVGSGPGQDLSIRRYLPLQDLWDFLRGREFMPEVVLWCDTCRPPLALGLETLPSLNVALSIDQYCNPWHYSYAAAFDLVLVAQKDYLPLFAAEDPGQAQEWFPLFCDSAGDADPGLGREDAFAERDVAVSFVGTLKGPLNTGRRAFLHAFRRRHPLVVRQGAYREMFGRSRIVLNQSAAGELNFRLFQAAACGAAVLTEDVGNGLRDLFTPGEDLLPPYPRGDAAAAAAAAAAALADPQALARVARAGRDLVRRRHSSAVRAAELVSLAGRLLARRAQARRLANPDRAREWVGNALNILASDDALPLDAEQRRMFLDLARTHRACR